VRGLQFLPLLFSTCYCLPSFHYSHPRRCQVASHCTFALHFPDN
jgi:hypothetical protein